MSGNNAANLNIIRTFNVIIISGSSGITTVHSLSFDPKNTMYDSYYTMNWIESTIDFVAIDTTTIIKFESTCIECGCYGPAIDCVCVFRTGTAPPTRTPTPTKTPRPTPTRTPKPTQLPSGCDCCFYVCVEEYIDNDACNINNNIIDFNFEQIIDIDKQMYDLIVNGNCLDIEVYEAKGTRCYGCNHPYTPNIPGNKPCDDFDTIISIDTIG
jgi:hypothetical protein